MTAKPLVPLAAVLGQLLAATSARGEQSWDPQEGAPRVRREETVPARDPTPPGPGFLRKLGRDFTLVVAPSNLMILGAGGAAALFAHPHDRQLTDEFRHSARLDGLLEGGAVAGDGLVQGGGAVATWLVGKACHSPKVAAIGEDLIRGQIVNGALTLSIKLATNRDRPDGTKWSFPSGHTSAAFTTATILERRLGWKVGVPFYAAAAYIGASRLQENKHFASDVLFGAAVGIVSGRSATFDHGQHHAGLVPLLAPGGIGAALIVRGR